ncbi:MAG TPA: thioredoxin domain-containing protein, partial [Chthonomonadales bacterium]|nr:thioredoxin domain-containing protein [Chthonomonadales bacterium]
DNALLSRLYLHAYLVTGKTFYRRITEETLDYVVREMTSPDGGFYSTQDADSEGEEGKFFLWTPAEVEAVLPPGDAALFMRYYDVTQQGNFEGKNILHVVGADVSRPGGEEETHVESSPGDIHAQLQRSRELLFKAREQRVKPGRDEKILTSWNGLMLRSFAEAARHLDRADYLEVAARNAGFLLRELRREGRVLRTYKDGRGRLNGYLEDYAFLADGLLALYEASFDTRWFVEARHLMDEAIALFADRQNGGFFDTGSDHEALVSRPKDIMDNATPAGNSVAAEVLLRLAAFSGEEEYRQRAGDYLRSLADIMVQHPQAFGHALGVLDFAISPVKEIAIIGEVSGAGTRNLLGVINKRYLPASVLACAAPGDSEAIQAIPLLADRPLKDEQATAYVCQNFACLAPVNTPGELERLL